MPPAAFDPWGVDAITMGIAILAAIITSGIRWFRNIQPILTRRRVTTDVLNGSVIYPFSLLVVSVANTSVFTYLKDSRISLALAGCVGIVFIAGELISSIVHDPPE